MNAREFQRWLQKQGCTFENHRSGSGHITVYRKGKDLGPNLVAKIKKQLGL
jgi:mRNA interferase HicA